MLPIYQPRYLQWLRSLGRNTKPDGNNLAFMEWVLEAKRFALSNNLGVRLERGLYEVKDRELFDKACEILADEGLDILAMNHVEHRINDR